ncbi:hypothetical protein HELRODRAFT_163137 [Helobdella robusta]|uniref:WSC domain-containing protein n=1 Tax=Helobdella robusta TaxID=6412 RepID=T1ETP8_HELRO|nr:hypothetical protein HELRODRAFT_163137 [Helobdella robusta]ESN96109.1 hypothetical protein HELRODRAFT_163137 [Helobdella robusta]
MSAVAGLTNFYIALKSTKHTKRVHALYIYMHATNYVNIALNKQAYLSTLSTDEGSKPSNAVDGNLTNLVMTNSTFGYSEWIVVDLVNAYQVKYVIVFNRGACVSCYAQMRNFVAGLTNYFDAKVNSSLRGNYDLCGTGPKLVVNPYQLMNVTCVDGEKFSRFVILQLSIQVEQVTLPQSLFVVVAEVEAYTDETFLQYDNVASLKPAYMKVPKFPCSPNYCVDENKASDCVSPYGSPTNENWFAVDLLRQYNIVYVVLYASSTAYSLMNYFAVGLTNNFDKNSTASIRSTYQICGRWKDFALPGAEAMRVDCANNGNIFARYVIVQQETSMLFNTMSFADIEVHGSENSIYKYMGCYKSFETQRTFFESSLDVCINLCKLSNVSYATVKDNSVCFCGVPSDLLPSSSCFANCDANAVCYSNFYAVYTTSISPGQLGCYTNADFADGMNSSPRTVKNCLQYCLERSFTYASLQGSSCFCGNSTGSYGKTSDCDCNITCSGDPSERCGGSSAKNVYLRK